MTGGENGDVMLAARRAAHDYLDIGSEAGYGEIDGGQVVPLYKMCLYFG